MDPFGVTCSNSILLQKQKKSLEERLGIFLYPQSRRNPKRSAWVCVKFDAFLRTLGVLEQSKPKCVGFRGQASSSS